MRLRLIASFILIVLVTIGVVILVTGRQTAQEVRNFMFRGGMTGSEEIVSALEAYYETHHTWTGAGEVLRNMPLNDRQGMWGPRLGGDSKNQQLPLAFQLRLTDENGNVLTNTRGNQSTEKLTQLELRRAVPLEVKGKTVGYLIPEGNQFFTQANEISLLSRLNRAAIIAVVVAGFVAVLLALILSYSLVRPVRALTTAAANLAEGDLTQRVPVQGNDDLAILGRTFNRMATSLQKAEDSRRALTADIAHELRTPLAVQLAHLEALEDGIYDLTPANLIPIEEQNRLLTRLVEDLRTLALADSGHLTLEITPTDLSALIQRVTSRIEPQADDRQIKIQLNLDESCPPLPIDSQRIEQILHNLLNNALRYTPAGGVISLQSSVTGLRSPGRGKPNTENRVLVSVRDFGPGIPEDALPHIFDRFYRADKSRSRAEGGIGLGLSIARKIAQTHGGDLTAANHPDGGAVFSLTLPG